MRAAIALLAEEGLSDRSVAGRLRLEEDCIGRWRRRSVQERVWGLSDRPRSGVRTTTPIPDMLAKFTLGAQVLSSTSWDVPLQYSTEIGDDYASHAGLGRLAYRFEPFTGTVARGWSLRRCAGPPPSDRRGWSDGSVVNTMCRCIIGGICS